MSLSNTQNLTTEQYIDNRNYNIKYSENRALLFGDFTKLNVHYDGKSFAMGYGYDIIQNLSTLKNDLREHVRLNGESDDSVNARLDKAIGYINEYLSGAKTEDDRNAFLSYINEEIPFQTEENAASLLGETIQKFETSLSASLGSHDLPQSNERAAVISQLYRLGSAGAPSLLEAIRQDNRAEAWFQIRYYSNADELDGNYTRVVNESNLFGLYDGGNFEVQAKEVMRMYILHKSKIEEEEGESLAYSGTNSIISQIEPSKNYLIQNYVNGITIDGEVFVGKGTDSYSYLESNSLDVHSGTAKNDLIFGEAGWDTLNGNGGTDVIYGGTGNDTINGGADYDFLYGEADNDTINGGAGDDYIEGGTGVDTIHGGTDNDTLQGNNDSDTLYGDAGDDTLLGGDDNASDVLIGGTGFDTYYVSHQDVIDDADGSGFVMFNDKAISGKKTKIDEYTYEDDDFTYSIDSSNLIVVDKNLGEYITIENYDDGDLGIDLDVESSNDKDITINISDSAVTEGDSGIKLMTFTISASRDLTGTESVTLDLNIEDFGTNSSDYGSLSDSSITFNATSKTQTVTLEIIGDTAIEPDEDLWLDATVTNKTDLETVSVILRLGTIIRYTNSLTLDVTKNRYNFVTYNNKQHLELNNCFYKVNSLGERGVA